MLSSFMAAWPASLLACPCLPSSEHGFVVVESLALVHGPSPRKVALQALDIFNEMVAVKQAAVLLTNMAVWCLRATQALPIIVGASHQAGKLRAAFHTLAPMVFACLKNEAVLSFWNLASNSALSGDDNSQGHIVAPNSIGD